jgi:hypothetical protein
MEFSINKNSTLPILKLELIRDGRNDFRKFHERIQNADIYFTMTNVVTGVKRIAKKKTTVSLVEPTNCVGEEYYLIYKFTEKDTSVAGRYAGYFEIKFLEGDEPEDASIDNGLLIVPIREELFINVLERTIKK